jgi:hypothetical protein
MQISKSTHRELFIDILAEDIRQIASDETLPFSTAAVRVLLGWLGYDVDDITFIDGSDRGIDAWLTVDAGIEIFQVKTHDQTSDGLLQLGNFDGEGVSDLRRAKEFLLHERDSNVRKRELKELLYRWDSAIRSRKIQESEVTLPITLHLIVLGDSLTEQAQAEFSAFQESNSGVIYVDEVPVQFFMVLHTIDDIIDTKWREQNRAWRDGKDQKHEAISLHPWPEEFISDNANAIFYCRAIDLVQAYDALGYQLFEPNVRANIKNSRVNQEIRQSLQHDRSRKEFRFLNNGVTMTCDQFSKPSGQRTYFSVNRPGIVNGLQTVVALHTAYQALSPFDKEDFVQNCSVFVRLLSKNAVEDITRVVKATNNQNPMKLRNLVSNSPEQLVYVRLFAEELGWFYEAKEGAWDAFSGDHARWRPRLNKHPRDFRVPNSRKERRLDNEDLAQTWLAFIGLASEAVNQKKFLFDERFYSLIFKKQLRQHGTDYDSFARVREEAIPQSPNHCLMLASYLSRKFAIEMSPTASQNRQDTCLRLGIDPDTMSKAELDVELSKDHEFILNQALGGMSLLFTEFIGFVFYRSLGDKIHRVGQRILESPSFATLVTDFAMETVKERAWTGNFEPDDLLIVLWLAFVDQIRDMLENDWGQGYRAAPIKVRFIFSTETRNRLYRKVQSLNDFMKKRTYTETWAVGVSEGQGLFEFVDACVMG